MSATAATTSARPELNARCWAVWGSVLTGGAAAIALSVDSLTVSPLGSGSVFGALVLLVLASLAFSRPFPVGIKGGDASLDVVFVVCAAVMYGAAVAALISATVCTLGCARVHQHPVKMCFNAAMINEFRPMLVAHAAPAASATAASRPAPLPDWACAARPAAPPVNPNAAALKHIFTGC